MDIQTELGDLYGEARKQLREALELQEMLVASNLALESEPCHECLELPVIEQMPHTKQLYCYCPVCGSSINPQFTLEEALMAWNSKQYYLSKEAYSVK
jgi:hypothetical protein